MDYLAEYKRGGATPLSLRIIVCQMKVLISTTWDHGEDKLMCVMIPSTEHGRQVVGTH